MKHLLRTLCTIAVLALMVCSFAACDNGGSGEGTSKAGGDDVVIDGKGQTITIATPRVVDLTPGVSDETDLLIKRIGEVEKKYNIKIAFESEIDQSDYWDAMVAKAMAGDVFGDIMLIYPYFLDEWVAGNIVADIAPIAEKVGVDWNDGSWDTQVLQTGTFGDKIYSFCREQTALTAGLIYNTQLLKKADLEDPSVWVKKDQWNFDKLEEYAKKLTVVDADGNVTQYGLSTTTCELFMGCFILANGATAVEYDQKGYPKLTLDSAKSLEALNTFNTMLNTDHTIECMSCLKNWQEAADAFCNGEVGMLVCEEWVIEYIRDVMNEAGNGEDYALTYFPKGPNGKDYVDASFGGMTEYFIYNSGDAEKEELAFRVYCDLYAPNEELSQEEQVATTAESLFSDENSVEVYEDIILNNKSESLNMYKLGLNVRQDFKDVFTNICNNAGTPQSIINSIKTEVESYMEESTYWIQIKEQNGD
ncbi:MAG: extracellular solute-binding protein [Clostridia bacterium]|nr:extracellular solute-binding protein [Clostridia bacterium]